MLKLGKLSNKEEEEEEEGCMGFGSMAFGLAVPKFLNVESFLHGKLN